MVDDVVHVVGLELVKDRNGYCPVSYDAQESGCPVGTVAPAQRDFVPFPDSCMFEQDMHFLYLSGHVLILQRSSFVVCQCITVPVGADAFFNKLYKTVLYFHFQIAKCLTQCVQK